MVEKNIGSLLMYNIILHYFKPLYNILIKKIQGIGR